MQPNVPPGPSGVFAPLANPLAFARDPLAFLTTLAREHGPASSFRFGGQRFFMFTHPEAVREALVTRAAALQKGFLLKRVGAIMHDTFGQGLLLSEGPVHERQRRSVAPAFHGEQVRRYAETMAEVARERLARWQDGTTIDVSAEMSATTLVILGKTLFRTELAGNASALSDAVTALMHLTERLRSPWSALLELWPGRPGQASVQAAREKLESAVQAIIREHGQKNAPGEPPNLLSVLLGAGAGDHGSQVNDAEVRDQVMTLLLAGHETTASTLAWALYLLSGHPEVEEAVAQEVRDVLGNRLLPEPSDLASLPLIRAVLSETLRLYPPAWIIIRKTVEPVTVAGWHLPTGSTFVLSPYVTHRDPALWPKADQFCPERWPTEGTRSQPARPGYFPFGAGPRSCVGEAFAWMEATLLLTAMLRSWRLVLAPGQAAVRPFAAVTLRPHGRLRMKLQRRTN
ncbi:MAG TPA: cytochrome P450 [Chthoniobacterales bacterium]